LVVNEALVNTVQDRNVRGAILAHEVAHLKRWDSLFFATAKPLLLPANLLLTLLRGMLGTIGPTAKTGGGMFMIFSRFLFPMSFSKTGLMIWFFTLFIVFGIIFTFAAILSMFLFYFFASLLVFLFAAAILLAVMRGTEKQADFIAAVVSGDSDLVLHGFAQTVDSFPAEILILRQFATPLHGHLPGKDFTLVVNGIRSGASLPPLGLAQRLFRSQPTVLERMTFLVSRFGSRIV
jgi:Zn-dependent protease with chaperone function